MTIAKLPAVGLLLVWLFAVPAGADENRRLIVVTGAPGLPEYEAMFDEWAGQWKLAAEKAQVPFVRIGAARPNKPDVPEPNDRDRVRDLLTELKDAGLAELWLVLIGHGTFDGETAKYNLRGPDFSAKELSQWIDSAAERTIVINCASSSAPFINRLAGTNRIVVTSTSSGFESNFSRFGQYLAESISAADIDLDKDRQVSLLEAFIAATSRTNEFYSSRARLATEHAVIEDNGDGRGTPGDWFRGIRAVKQSEDGTPADGLRANQVFLDPGPEIVKLTSAVRAQRDELEQQLEQLRQSKDSMSDEQYLQRLEPILIQLAELYRDASDASDASADGAGASAK